MIASTSRISQKYGLDQSRAMALTMTKITAKTKPAAQKSSMPKNLHPQPRTLQGGF
jgi:hypothetical protein